jgi:ERCC4-related helicase
MSVSPELALPTVQASLESIRKIALTSPEKVNDIQRDLESLYQRYLAQAQAHTSASLSPLHSSNSLEFERRESIKYKNTRAWRELSVMMGASLRITEVRKAADTLSRSRLVPLSPEVRNHADKLMAWFEQNWDALAPGMRNGGNFQVSNHH